MEAVNGVSEGDKGAPPPPSPLTGCYLLIVIGEPHCTEHKDIILQRVAKGLLSWDINECLVDLEKELSIITEQALEGEEARFGERLIQFASENLVTEILIHPAVSTLAQCIRNLLSSFTRHRHIIHAGYTFAGNGSWSLQDGTFSFVDFSEAFQEIEVQRVLHAYENGISLDIHCAPEGEWSRLPKEPFARNCKLRVNPDDVLAVGSPYIHSFIDYISPFLISTPLENLLESSDVVGNIRFSRPTLYVFPGGQGDAALFGINGFNMLLDGGFSRKACFWDFVRHLDRLDAVLMTRLNNSNVNGINSVLKRKRQDAMYPQIGHFFCNLQERKAILSPDGDKDKDPLLINLIEEGDEIISNLRHLSLMPQVCYRDSEPINLYHKVGHGTLDMYVLSPAKESKEVKDFLQKWNSSDQKLFANPKSSRDFTIPLHNLVSICALLVWRPANSNDTITRILYPGSCPQNKIFDGLDRLRQLEFIKHPICSERSLAPPLKSRQIKEPILDKVHEKQKFPLDNRKDRPKHQEKNVENKLIENNLVNGVQIQKPERGVKKSDSTESEKSTKAKKPEENKIIENGDRTEKPKAKSKPARVRGESQQRKEKKASPTTPKKALDNNKVNGDMKDLKSKILSKPSPTATPAKSAKDANNRKVVESKIKAAPKKDSSKPPEKKAKTERQPISRRPKEPKVPVSPVKKVNGVQKPDVISKRGKLDKEGTTDSSTVSTPSADQDSVLKKDITKLTPEELQNLKAQELADLKEEQEAVKEIEAVFMKGEVKGDIATNLRKVKDISLDDKLEQEEYLIIEKEEIDHDSLEDKDTKEDETQKLARDSEESEKQRKLSGDIQKPGDSLVVSTELEEKDVGKLEDAPAENIEITTVKDEPITSKEVSITSPEDKLEMSMDKKPTDKENEEEIKEAASQPDEKVSATIESGATTTAPTLPEDERIPLDEIKEDNGLPIVEKHSKEETKEKEIPVIQLPPKTFDAVSKLPPVVGIRLDKQSHIRDIVKTPDEVAELPVHEEVDIDHYISYQHEAKPGESLDNKQENGKMSTEEIKIPGDEKSDTKPEIANDENVKHEKAIDMKDEQEYDNEKQITPITATEKEGKFDEAPVEKSTKELKKRDVLCEKELSKSPEEEKDKDEHEIKVQSAKQLEFDKESTMNGSTEQNILSKKLEEENLVQDVEVSPDKLDISEEKYLAAESQKKQFVTQAVDEKPMDDIKSHGDIKKDIEPTIATEINVDKTDLGEKLKSDVGSEVPAVFEQEYKPSDISIEENKDIVKQSEIIKIVKEDVNQLTKLDEKLQKLKEAETNKTKEIIRSDATVIETEAKVGRLDQAQHAESVKISDSAPESPHAEDEKLHTDYADRLELGRKSPKEREDDVIKIVATVAEVLKSDAPLEEFEGKIPFSTHSPYTAPYSAELRETHITTVDSPITQEKMIEEVPVDISTKSSNLSFIADEQKVAPLHAEKLENGAKIEKNVEAGTIDEDNDSTEHIKDELEMKGKLKEVVEQKRSSLIKDSQELMSETSKMISGIKSTQSPKVEDSDDSGTVHRMLVTASSEDGGEEFEICPAGTITFSKSSESSGRSSPENQSQKLSQKSSIADTVSDSLTTVKHAKDSTASTDEVAGDSKGQDISREEGESEKLQQTEVVCLSEKTSPDVKETGELSSGKTTPDLDKKIAEKDTLNKSGKTTPDIKEVLSDIKEASIHSSRKSTPDMNDLESESLAEVETNHLKSSMLEDAKEDDATSLKTAEKDISGKVSPETKQSSQHTSGHVTPEAKLDTTLLNLEQELKASEIQSDISQESTENMTDMLKSVVIDRSESMKLSDDGFVDISPSDIKDIPDDNAGTSRTEVHYDKVSPDLGRESSPLLADKGELSFKEQEKTDVSKPTTDGDEAEKKEKEGSTDEHEYSSDVLSHGMAKESADFTERTAKDTNIEAVPESLVAKESKANLDMSKTVSLGKYEKHDGSTPVKELHQAKVTISEMFSEVKDADVPSVTEETITDTLHPPEKILDITKSASDEPNISSSGLTIGDKLQIKDDVQDNLSKKFSELADKTVSGIKQALDEITDLSKSVEFDKCEIHGTKTDTSGLALEEKQDERDLASVCDKKESEEIFGKENINTVEHVKPLDEKPSAEKVTDSDIAKEFSQLADETVSDLSHTIKDITDMSKSIVFDKCEKHETETESMTSKSHDTAVPFTFPGVSDAHTTKDTSDYQTFDVKEPPQSLTHKTDINDKIQSDGKVSDVAKEFSELADKTVSGITETLEDIAGISKSVIFDKCEKQVKEAEKAIDDKVRHTAIKSESEKLESKIDTSSEIANGFPEFPEKIASDINEALEDVTEMPTSLIFDKCEKDREALDQKLQPDVEKQIEENMSDRNYAKEFSELSDKAVAGVSEALDDISDMSKSIIFEKCEKHHIENDRVELDEITNGEQKTDTIESDHLRASTASEVQEVKAVPKTMVQEKGEEGNEIEKKLGDEVIKEFSDLADKTVENLNETLHDITEMSKTIKFEKCDDTKTHICDKSDGTLDKDDTPVKVDVTEKQSDVPIIKEFSDLSDKLASDLNETLEEVADMTKSLLFDTCKKHEEIEVSKIKDADEVETETVAESVTIKTAPSTKEPAKALDSTTDLDTDLKVTPDAKTKLDDLSKYVCSDLAQESASDDGKFTTIKTDTHRVIGDVLNGEIDHDLESNADADGCDKKPVSNREEPQHDLGIESHTKNIVLGTEKTREDISSSKSQELVLSKSDKTESTVHGGEVREYSEDVIKSEAQSKEVAAKLKSSIQSDSSALHPAGKDIEDDRKGLLGKLSPEHIEAVAPSDKEITKEFDEIVIETSSNILSDHKAKKGSLEKDVTTEHIHTETVKQGEVLSNINTEDVEPTMILSSQTAQSTETSTGIPSPSKKISGIIELEEETQKHKEADGSVKKGDIDASIKPKVSKTSENNFVILKEEAADDAKETVCKIEKVLDVKIDKEDQISQVKSYISHSMESKVSTSSTTTTNVHASSSDGKPSQILGTKTDIDAMLHADGEEKSVKTEISDPKQDDKKVLDIAAGTTTTNVHDSPSNGKPSQMSEMKTEIDVTLHVDGDEKSVKTEISDPKQDDKKVLDIAAGTTTTNVHDSPSDGKPSQMSETRTDIDVTLHADGDEKSVKTEISDPKQDDEKVLDIASGITTTNIHASPSNGKACQISETRSEIDATLHAGSDEKSVKSEISGPKQDDEKVLDIASGITTTNVHASPSDGKACQISETRSEIDATLHAGSDEKSVKTEISDPKQDDKKVLDIAADTTTTSVHVSPSDGKPSQMSDTRTEIDVMLHANGDEKSLKTEISDSKQDHEKVLDIDAGITSTNVYVSPSDGKASQMSETRTEVDAMLHADGDEKSVKTEISDPKQDDKKVLDVAAGTTTTSVHVSPSDGKPSQMSKTRTEIDVTLHANGDEKSVKTEISDSKQDDEMVLDIDAGITTTNVYGSPSDGKASLISETRTEDDAMLHADGDEKPVKSEIPAKQEDKKVLDIVAGTTTTNVHGSPSDGKPSQMTETRTEIDDMLHVDGDDQSVKTEISDPKQDDKKVLDIAAASSERAKDDTDTKKSETGEHAVLILESPEGKKLSISDVEISLEEQKTPCLTKHDISDCTSSSIDIKKTQRPDAENLSKSEGSATHISTHEIKPTDSAQIDSKSVTGSIAGPSSHLESCSNIAPPSGMSLSRKSTPDIADVESIKEAQDTLTYEKHIPGTSTPPTVPVSPNILESTPTISQEDKTSITESKTVSSETHMLTSGKEIDVRSSTPASDDFDIGISTHSDISTGQASRAPYLSESERLESDVDDVPGSPLSLTSQVAHSRSSSHYEFDEDANRIPSKTDPMKMSLYGSLPDDPLEKEIKDSLVAAVAIEESSSGKTLPETSFTYLHDLTVAKYTVGTKSSTSEAMCKPSEIQVSSREEDLMTSSFIGTELPKEREDPIAHWGKPLGLPSPAPQNDNKGTPKKEKKLPANVSAKNKLNDDKKRAESPSKYKNKKVNPVYVDLTYVPHHGNAYYSYVDFFRRVRARYYVFSGIEPSREVYNALLEAKQTWEDKELEVTIIPTYDTDVLGYWVAENEELLTKYKIDLSPSASRCTINLQDHETSCSAYRLEF